MWYEHGQTNQLVNLELVQRIQMRDEESILMTTVTGMFILLDYEDAAEASEAFQVIRYHLKLSTFTREKRICR